MRQDDEAREVAEEAWLLDQVWGKWGEEEATGVKWERNGETVRRTTYVAM